MNKPYHAQKFNAYGPIPPPPPPPKKAHTVRNLAVVLVLVSILVIPVVFFYSGLIGENPQTSPSPSSTPLATTTPYRTPNTTPSTTPSGNNPQTQVTITKGQTTQVTTQTISSSGGTIQTDSSSAINGLKIKVPEAATTNPVQFQVSYSDISSINNLPAGASAKSKLISIETSGSEIWNEFKLFDKPIEVTLPYDSTATNDDSRPIRFYWYDEQTGKLDSVGLLNEDKDAHTITFLTASFSKFVAIEISLQLSELTNLGYSVDTGFRPATDGWYIPNYGSYLQSGGTCLGMVSYAKWYHSYIKGGSGVGLYNNYIEGNPTEWRDDKTAIQLATRAQTGTSGIWGALTAEEKGWATANAREVALSWIHGMIVTDEPQLIGLMARYTNGTWRNGGHAVLAYGYSNGMFEIYDPNFPGTSTGTRMRQIPFSYLSGFNETYVSGLTRSDSLVFNIFYHAGAKLAATPGAYSGLYLSAQKQFKDDSIFPTVTLTDTTTTPLGTTPIDTDGDNLRDTGANTAVISGTITGGQHQINSTLIFVSNQKYTARVENGAFSQEVPLYNGENEVVILATDENTFSNWAGFLSSSIKSNATIASMTITLTWSQDNSDVDLHILEPGTSGRHIYYYNKGYSSNNPYLDMDNTHGYGPEHYYATEIMTLPDSTSLYGKYQIRVHYFADHDSDDETTQPITWHLNVRYLAFKDLNTGQEFWAEDSRSGVLTVEDRNSASEFSSGSAAWSDVWTIQYDAPNAQNYNIPPPPQNVFPT